MVSFENEHVLFAGILLLVPLLLFFSVVRWKKKVQKKLGEPSIIKYLIGNYSPGRFKTKFVLTIVALLLIVIAAAGPSVVLNHDDAQKKSGSLLIALDVSNSMRTADSRPSRIERAKGLIKDILNQDSYNRVGLVCFAGEAFLQVPLTSDLAGANTFVDSLTTNDIPVPGTSIGAALRLCDSAFNIPEKGTRTVILISDGEDRDTTAITAANSLRQKGVAVFSIGIGTAAGAMIPDSSAGGYMENDDGGVVISKLNEALLKKIADVTNGEYFFYDNDISAESVLTQISNWKENKQEVAANSLSFPFFELFLIVAMLLLLWEVLMPEIKYPQKNIA